MLLVENEESCAILTVALLTNYVKDRYEITIVERLDTALQAIEDTMFDVILLDLGLEDSRGIGTLVKVKTKINELSERNPWYRKTPIIALTGTEGETVASEVIKAGGMGYLPKTETTQKMLIREIDEAMARQVVDNEKDALIRRLNDSIERVDESNDNIIKCIHGLTDKVGKA